MCHKRILRLLKLRGLKRGKRSIKYMLRFGCEAIQKAGETSEFSLLLETFEKIESLVDAWLLTDTTHQTDNTRPKLLNLKRIVVGVYDIQQRQNISSMIEKIPDSTDFDSSRRASLLNIIKMVAVYRECVPSLRRIERTFRVFGQMNVVLVKLPTKAFDITPVDHLEATHDANGKQIELASETLIKGKIHAEIQLLFHCYELGKMKFLPPRVLVSSKDACYLCNAFISIHGRMHVPGIHGRLYNRWRLPKICNEDMYSIFVEHLDGLVRKRIAMSPLTNRCFPIESTPVEPLGFLEDEEY